MEPHARAPRVAAGERERSSPLRNFITPPFQMRSAGRTHVNHHVNAQCLIDSPCGSV
jgi:hypothetical protein